MTTATNSSVALRAGIDGSVRAGVQFLGHHRVVSFTISGDSRSMSQADGMTISAACELARAKGHPVVGFVQSTGTDVREGIAAAHGWGSAARAMIKCSGVVPTVLVVTGPVVAAPALMLGVADLSIMVEDAYAYVSGPAMVEQFTGLPVDHDDLGGPAIHATRSGVVTAVVADTDAAIELVDELLSYLPASNSELAPFRPTADPAGRLCPELRDIVPTNSSGSYDVRTVVEAIVDDGIIAELRPRWAGNLITAFANVGGHCVGIVANQPQVLAGTLDIAASQKGARFVDTPGFQPGKDLEWRGMIRHGAQLAFAYARSTVPRISITLRKSYGGAYIVMDSKTMGNDLALAWPSAEIAVMGAKGAVEILHRKASLAERAEIEADYERRLLNPYVAAERGSIDMVIDPAETRREIAGGLDLLATKRERLARRRHDNSPL